MADNLGTASVDITAELEPLHKGLAQARSDLQSSLDGMTSDVSKFDTDAGKLVQGLTDKFRNLASIFGIGFGIREALSAIEGGQTALARLGSVLASTGGAAGFTKQQLIDMASALGETTTFSRTAVEGAEGVLLTFTHIGHNIFPQALQATVNLAAALGTDLSTAAREVGRALDDPVGGMALLSREGITLDESQKQALKSMAAVGNLSGEQAMVLALLATRFGGAATAARDTLGGALAAVGHAFEDFTQDVGGSTGALNNATNALAAWVAESDKAVQLENQLGAQQERLGKNSSVAALSGSLVAMSKERDALLTGGAAALAKYNIPIGEVSQAVANLNAQIETGRHRLDALVDSSGLGHTAKPAAAAASGLSPDASKAAEEAAKAQQHLQETFDKTNLSINLQAADYQRLADAIGHGTDAMRSAQIANDIAGEQSKLGPGATPAMLSQIAQEVTARDQQKFALDDYKASLEAANREQEKSNALLQTAIDAASGDTGKLKEVGDQYEALAMAIQDDDLPAMLQMNTALTGMGKELDDTAKSAAKTSMVLDEELAKGAESIANTLINTSSSLFTLDQSMNKSGESAHKFGKHFHESETAMQAFSKAGLEISKTIEKMILELTIVNPLLNALQGAITGKPGTKPSMFGGGGSSSSGSGSPSSSSSIGGMLSKGASMVGGGINDAWGFIKSLISSPNGSPDPAMFANFTSSIGAMLDSSSASDPAAGDAIANAIANQGFATSGAEGTAGLATIFASAFGFASGGSFDVGGAGATDSQFVAFKATPGEHVQVGQNAPPVGGGSTTNVHVMNNSGASATVTKKSNSSGGHDVMVQIGEAMANDVATGGALSRSISQNLGANRVPISR